MTRRLALFAMALVIACGERARTPSEATPMAVAPQITATGGYLADRIRAARAVADADPRYAPLADEAGFLVAQPGGIAATVTSAGARVRLGDRHVGIAVASVGRSTLADASRSTLPTSDAHRVSIDRAAGMSEW